jgi:uncharacterized transporter YbjL
MKLIKKILKQEIAMARSGSSNGSQTATPQSRLGRNYIQITATQQSKSKAAHPTIIRSADAINQHNRGAYTNLCAHLLVNKKIKSGVFLYTPSSDQVYQSIATLAHNGGTKGVNRTNRKVGVKTNPENIITDSRLIKAQSIAVPQVDVSGKTMLDLLKRERSKGSQSAQILVNRVKQCKTTKEHESLSTARNALAKSQNVSKQPSRTRNTYDSLASLAPADWVNLVVGYYLRH